MKKSFCILAVSLLAASTSALALPFFSKEQPLTAIAASSTAAAAMPSETPLPAPTVDLKATPTPTSSSLAKPEAKPKAKPEAPLGKAKIAPEEESTAKENPANLQQEAPLDFAPKKFDVMVPPPSDWAESLLDASGVNSLYAYLFDHQGRRKKSRHMIKVGTVYLPTTMVTTNATSGTGEFTMRRLAMQYVLVPKPNGVNRVKRYIKGFRVEFLISANKQNCIQIKDILPSTVFANANFGGKLGVSTAVCMSSAGQFMPASAAREDVGGSFVWTYQPKDLEIVSGAVGNSAFIEFEPRNDGTFYVGQVPIEISLMVPRGVKTADLRIVNTLITNENKLLPLGEISSKVILP